MSYRLQIIDLFGRTNINKWYSFLQKSQYWSISEQEAYQNEKLQQLVKHAFEQVPYYKKLFKELHLSPADIRCKEDLQKLPVIRRSDLQQNYLALMAGNHESYHSQYRSTGGTTGIPTKYLSDMNSWSLHWALKYRGWEWSTYNIGDKVAIFGGASLIPDEKTSLSRKIWNQINQFYPMPSTHLSENDLEGHASVIKQHNIKCLRGYPSSIAMFANFCRENNIVINIDSVITTAEVLLPNYKAGIVSAFNPVIIDSYGCADAGGNANTCIHDKGFHVSVESAVWEVCNANGFPVDLNEKGEVTLTSLSNYAMPLLRYQPGDVIINNFDESVCSCGCTLPRIKNIVGRTTDVIRFSNGRSLSGPALTVLFSKFSLNKYQVIQNSENSVDINLIPGTQFDQKQYNRILELMKHHCGAGIEIFIYKVDNIPTPYSGKHRFIINNTLK